MSRTHLGREVTLEEAYRYRCRVEIRWVEGFGYPGPVIRGYISKNSPEAKARIYILLRRRDSMGGYAISQDEIASMREVRYRL